MLLKEPREHVVLKTQSDLLRAVRNPRVKLEIRDIATGSDYQQVLWRFNVIPRPYAVVIITPKGK